MKKTTHRSPDRAASSLTSASGLTAGTTAGCGTHDFPRLLGQFRADVRAAEAVARRLPPDEGLAYVLSEVRLDLDCLERAVQVSEPAGLPPHWSTSVRRNWWGTWTATGTYSGPELDQPIEVVSGWCWTRAQATEQVGYWIEDTELARAEWLTPTERQAGQQQNLGGDTAADLAWELEEAVAAEDTHENDVARAEAYFARQEEDHYRDLDWNQAIFEDTYGRAHGRSPGEYGTGQERGRR